MIGPAGGGLDHDQSFGQRGVEAERDAADVEVFRGTQCLYAVKALMRHVAVTQQIVFAARASALVLRGHVDHMRRDLPHASGNNLGDAGDHAHADAAVFVEYG